MKNIIKRILFNVLLGLTLALPIACQLETNTRVFDSTQQYLQTVQALETYLTTNCGIFEEDALIAVQAVYHTLLDEEFPIHKDHLSALELSIITRCQQQYQSCLTSRALLSKQNLLP